MPPAPLAAWSATTLELASHLWQSTAVALAILALLALASSLSARTRRNLAWIALAKFAVPTALLVALAAAVPGVPAHWVRSDLLTFSAGAAVAAPAEYARPSVMVSPKGDPSVAAATVGALVSAPASRPWTLLEWLGAAWAAGFIVVFGLWWVRRTRAVRAILADAAPADHRLFLELGRIAARFGFATPRCLVVGASIGPATLGVRAPRLLLPRGLVESLTPAEFQSVILHELVHVQRRDNLWALVRAFAVSALWFHPLAWLLSRHLNLETERSCDERVLELTRDPDAYAGGIMKSLRHSLGLPQPGFVSITTPPIVERLRHILSPRPRPERPLARAAAMLAALALALLAGHAGSISAAPADPAAPATVQAARPISQPNPVYPVMMRRNEIAGQVRVRFVVNPAGNVENPTVVASSHPEFDRAAIDAISRWKFQPATRAGTAVASTEEVLLHFEIGTAATPRITELLNARPTGTTLPPQVLMHAPEDPGREAQNAPPANVPDASLQTKEGRIVPPQAAGQNPTPAGQVVDPSMLDQRARPLSQVWPAYPAAMTKQRVAGEVVVRFVVDPTGTVLSPTVVRSSQREFEAAALEAMAQWKFAPSTKAGRPIATWEEQTFRFEPPIVTPAMPAPGTLHVGRIGLRIPGSTAVLDPSIRTHLKISEGEVFSPEALDRDIRALFQTGLFEMVQALTPAGNVPGTVDITFELTPKGGAADMPMMAPVGSGTRVVADAPVTYSVINRAFSDPPGIPDGATFVPGGPSFTANPAPAAGARGSVLQQPAEVMLPAIVPSETPEAAKARLEEEARKARGLQQPAAPARAAPLGKMAIGSPEDRIAQAAPPVPPKATVRATPPATREPVGQVFDPSMLDEPPRPTLQGMPVYPVSLRKQGVRGQVLVRYVVDATGKVVNAEAVSSTQREFEQAAVDAVSKWKFRAGRKGGKSVASWMETPIVFHFN